MTIIHNKPISLPAGSTIAIGLAGVGFDDRLRGKVKKTMQASAIGFPAGLSCNGFEVVPQAEGLPPGSLDAAGAPATHGDGATCYAFLQNTNAQDMSALLDVVNDA